MRFVIASSALTVALASLKSLRYGGGLGLDRDGVEVGAMNGAYDLREPMEYEEYSHHSSAFSAQARSHVILPLQTMYNSDTVKEGSESFGGYIQNVSEVTQFLNYVAVKELQWWWRNVLLFRQLKGMESVTYESVLDTERSVRQALDHYPAFLANSKSEHLKPALKNALSMPESSSHLMRKFRSSVEQRVSQLKEFMVLFARMLLEGKNEGRIAEHLGAQVDSALTDAFSVGQLLDL